MKPKLIKIVESSFKEVNKMMSEQVDLSDLMSITVYGNGGVFDSMGLVNFITIVEETIYDDLDIEISLLSEKALSMKQSPFSTVSNLIDFMLIEIEEFKKVT